MASNVFQVASTEIFFWSVLRDTNIGLTDEAMAYLIRLLVAFSRSEDAFAGAGRGKRVVLVDFLIRAQAAHASERAQIYQHIGDTALFTVGLFAESLPANRSYYLSVGGGAYQSAATLTKRPTVAVVLEEMGSRFKDVADALTGALT